MVNVPSLVIPSFALTPVSLANVNVGNGRITNVACDFAVAACSFAVKSANLINGVSKALVKSSVATAMAFCEPLAIVDTVTAPLFVVKV